MRIGMRELSRLAINAEPLRDKFVYRGFVDENADPGMEYDYSEDTLVKISPIGKFVGSSPDGKPTVETIDEESVVQMAKQTEELLLDKDHASMRGPEDRNTEAYGWISGLKAIIGLGDIDGLYGLIKWTSKGMALAKDRIYRFLSPVFELDANGRAIRLVNVALTNRPALPLPPIMNSEAKEGQISITNSIKDTDNMNKEEIMDFVREAVKTAIAENSKACDASVAKNEEQNPEETEPKAEEQKQDASEEQKQETSEQKQETSEQKPEEQEQETPEQKPETSEEQPKEVQASEPETSEPKQEEQKTETSEQKEKEVIGQDVLNSASPIADAEPWRNLHGKAFFDWLSSNRGKI